MRVFRHPVIRAALLLGVGLSCALDASPARAQADESAITPPSLVTRQDPTYPPAALTEKREGEVALEITIDETGKVTEAKVTQSAGPDLDAAAIAAVKAWTFIPAKRGTTAI